MNVLLTFCYNFFFKSKSSSTHFFDNLCQLWSDLMWFDLLNSILISFFVFFKIDYTYLNFLNFHKITTLLLILRLREPKLAIKKEEDFFLLGMAEVNWSVSCISLWLSSWRPILGVVIWQKICWFLKREFLLLPFPVVRIFVFSSNSSNQSLNQSIWQENFFWNKNASKFRSAARLPFQIKFIYLFWEGNIILRNLPLTFDCMYCSQK